MKQTTKKHRTIRSVYPHAQLFSVAEDALERANRDISNCFDDCLITIMFSAFALESFLNYLGKEKLSFWDKVERGMSPAGKLALLLHTIGKSVDMSRRPFQSFNQVFNFRNALVHGKPETITYSGDRKLKEGEPPGRPLATWESSCNPRNANRYFKDTEQMIHQMEAGLGFVTLDCFASYGEPYRDDD